MQAVGLTVIGGGRWKPPVGAVSNEMRFIAGIPSPIYVSGKLVALENRGIPRGPKYYMPRSSPMMSTSIAFVLRIFLK